MANNTILIDKLEGIGIITLNRPEVLNALSLELMKELEDAIEALESSNDVACIIITGSGDKAFSAGADIHEMKVMDPEELEMAQHVRYRVHWRIASCKKPIIGAINGLCYGGATVLATSLDFLIGCEKSTFKFLAVSYGQINATWTLPLIIGLPKAKEILYTGRTVTANEAKEIGLLNHLVAPEQLLDKAIGLATNIANNYSVSVQGIKNLISENIGTSWKNMWLSEFDARRGKYKNLSPKESFKNFPGRKEN
tara:strand:+ start:3440 stop:4198 length:759 start_codon:yes stop_codon:yes gene_type:complete